MPGGYISPFANPCSWPVYSSLCGEYDHKNGKYLKVPAMLNTTTVKEIGGTEGMIAARGTGGAVGLAKFCADTSPNDPNFPAGGWPTYFGTDSTHYRPDNRFTLGTYQCVATVAIASGGTGYKKLDMLSIPGEVPALVQVIKIGGTGDTGPVTQVAIFNSGMFYTSIPTSPNSPTGGTGTGASLTFTLTTKNQTVDLSGPCRAVGRQQAQFLRYWHGMFDFTTRVEPAGRNAAGSGWAGTQYCSMAVVSTLAQDIAISWDTHDSGGAIIPGTHGDQGWKYGMGVEMTMAVDKLSGMLTRPHFVAPYDTTVFTGLGGAVIATGSVTPIQTGWWPGNAWSSWSAYSDTSAVQQVVLGLFSGPASGFSAYVLDPVGNVFSPTSAEFGLPNWDTTLSGFSVSATNLHYELTVTPQTWSTTPDGSGNYVAYTSSGSVIITFDVTLTDSNSWSDVLTDIANNLETLWDYTNRAKHPFRTDNVPSAAAMYRRREKPVGVSPRIFNTDSTYYDPDGYFTPAGGSAKLAIYDGSVLDAMRAEGYGYGTPTSTLQGNGCFDFDKINYGGASCTTLTYGDTTPFDDGSGGPLLPQNCQRWTNPYLAGALWPCEFVAVGCPAPYAHGGDHYYDPTMILVQRWREVQIRVRSENPCRPFGKDKTVRNWDAILSCFDDGTFSTNSPASGTRYTLPPFKWPSCPGLIFSDTPGVGGRVRVTAVAAGVAALDFAQPYFCLQSDGTTTMTETVKVFDKAMSYLGTATATRVNATHFSGFSSYDGTGTNPLAAWITPVTRNDGTTAWVYSDCDDFPKGHWVEEQYLFDFSTWDVSGSPTATLRCTQPVACEPTILAPTATNSAGPYTVKLAKVRQWDTSQFWQQAKHCSGGSAIHVGVDLSDCTTVPPFVEATSLTPDAIPPQAGADLCGSNTITYMPWNIFAKCPAEFPL